MLRIKPARKLKIRKCEFMKKQLKLLPLLVVIIVGTFTFANSLLFPTVSATYVEGSITQDTIWTLTDSPFVVSKNVTVYPNVKLTIEPGVEIKFGEKFSLIVNGQLIANGTQDKMITFTSNKDQPEAGDWNAIEFKGTEPSVLAYCSIKYAKHGTTIENGNVEIKNCEISDNLESGIYVTGNNQATIQNNTIRSNLDGILLTGNSTSGVNIRQNTVLSNTQSGIHLDADAYNNIGILYNVLSANTKGFYVSGQASTSITNNSISYNNVGIYYEQAQDHEAHWNDIYGNDYGMDVTSNAVVDATYNYWGNESGPYHISLNPAGKGDLAGGDGVNLDFIFFLTAPIGYINERPTARLLTDKKVVPPNQIVTFIATTSSDDRQVNQYFFDFGDGKNSSWTTLSIFVHEYSSVGTYNPSVTVKDDFDVTSSNLATVTISVQALTPLDVSLISNRYTVGSVEQVSITVHVTDGFNAVEDANITLFPIIGGSFAPSSGVTNSTGYFTATFTAPNVTKITNVRITATASKSGYADGSDYKYLEALPILLVQVTADPTTIISETISNAAVHVTSSGQPVADAVVTILSDSGGDFLTTTGATDSDGYVAFAFTAPQTTTQLNVTISATAAKSGYMDGQGQTKITVEPKVLLVQVVSGYSSINSEMTSNVTVYVTCGLNPISYATVTLSSNNGGSFYPVNGTTDANGECVFTFTSPRVTTPSDVTISATAAKSGYMDGQGQTKITVNPAAVPTVGGLPLTIILMIAAVIIVVVVLVLIKLKIIHIHSKEV